MDKSAILTALEKLGEDGRSAADWLRVHHTQIAHRPQGRATAAMWWLDGNIYLNPRFCSLDSAPDHPLVLSLVVHETCHLQQGLLTALSVYGELEAWQKDFRMQCLLGRPTKHPAVLELLGLPCVRDREVLRRARVLMQQYAGKGYRVDLLPLLPLPQELRCLLVGGE